MAWGLFNTEVLRTYFSYLKHMHWAALFMLFQFQQNVRRQRSTIWSTGNVTAFISSDKSTFQSIFPHEGEEISSSKAVWICKKLPSLLRWLTSSFCACTWVFHASFHARVGTRFPSQPTIRNWIEGLLEVYVNRFQCTFNSFWLIVVINYLR